MQKDTRLLSIILVLTALQAVSLRAQHPAMPPGMTHEEHLAQMQKEAELKRRGEAAMGFDQGASTHHFTLTPEGGRIDVTVNDPSNATGVAQIRTHLATIAGEFANGNFGAPLATHGDTPPGVQTLRSKKTTIRYRRRYASWGSRGDRDVGQQGAVSDSHLLTLSNSRARDWRSCVNNR